MTVHTIKQCRPDQKETEYFWKLFHAAQRNDARWHGSESSIIADELSRTDLDRNQKLFLLRAWQVLVGVRLENGNYPTLSVLSLTGDCVPLSEPPDRKGCTE